MARVKPQSRAEAAATAQRLAVLLQAGIVPAAAWELLDHPSAAQIAGRMRHGQSAGEAIRAQGPAWHELATAWDVALAVGAPLADTLRSFAAALRDAVDTLDDVAVTLAEPAGTARLMLWLPVAGLGLGIALGFDSLRVLTTDPRGLACLVAGLGLLAAARAWTTVLVRRARPADRLPGASAELFAIALSGGASIDRARRLVGAAGADDGVEHSIDDGIDDVLTLSGTAGVPAVELLRAHAAEQRRTARVTGRTAAARLSTRLLLPLGVCTLPAFLLLGVAPLLLAVLAFTGVSLP